ncbi:MAG TPA: hypothetical protein VHK67_07145 [Rhabdochlamydiaceae bacterium]|jgi:hypothetical protein|nr:hypothetical protein [Rhabdochlamydiaceae bacterium]
MSTSARPVTYAQAPVPACFSYTQRSLAQKTSAVASGRIEGSSTADLAQTTKLVGEQSQSYDFPGKLAEAYDFLQTEENRLAEMLFQEIFNQFTIANLGKDSLVGIHCLLGMAYATKKPEYTSKAIGALNLVKVNIKHWNKIDFNSSSKAFLELRTCYRLLLPLIHPEETAQIQEMSNEIMACSIPLDLKDQFDDWVREGDRCAQRMEPSNARRLYCKALEIKLPPDGFNSIATTSCELKYASTLSKNSQQRVAFLKKTVNRLNESFSTRSGCPPRLQPAFLGSLVELFTNLLALLPENYENRDEIQKNLETCESELSKVAIPNRKKKVSIGFPGSSRSTRVFLRGVVIFLAAFCAFTLLRRSVSIMR